jgi:predicted dehydrogenase
MEPAFPYNGMRLMAHTFDGTDLDMPDPQHDPAQFTTQADYFADCVWNNREPKTDGQEGLRDITIMSQIYEAAGMRPL